MKLSFASLAAEHAEVLERSYGVAGEPVWPVPDHHDEDSARALTEARAFRALHTQLEQIEQGDSDTTDFMGILNFLAAGFDSEAESLSEAQPQELAEGGK